MSEMVKNHQRFINKIDLLTLKIYVDSTKFQQVCAEYAIKIDDYEKMNHR